MPFTSYFIGFDGDGPDGAGGAAERPNVLEPNENPVDCAGAAAGGGAAAAVNPHANEGFVVVLSAVLFKVAPNIL